MIQEALKTQLAFVHFSVHKNLEGLTHEDSLRGPEGGGNCINWVLGHIVASRAGTLGLLGKEAPLGEERAALYKRGSAPLGPGSECLPLEELVRQYDASQETLLAALEGADAAVLERLVPALFEPEKQEPCASQLAALVFHEAYHAGQLGVIRHAIGLQPAIQ